MTIEEATKLLKMSDQAIWLKGLEKEQKEAEDMAIKSLEAWEEVKQDLYKFASDSFDVEYAECYRIALRCIEGHLKEVSDMTLDEAKNILINRGFVEINGDQVFDGNKWQNAITVISKWLEQEPCEDAISRQAVMDVLGDSINDDKDYHRAVVLLNNLPSITPKENTGKWFDDANKIDAQFGRHTYICSECGKYAEYFISGTEVWWDRIKPNYCPNCGCRMRGDSNGNE